MRWRGRSTTSTAGAPRQSDACAAVIAIVVAVHSLQAHKEYPFVFAVVPLWLLVGADLAARLTASARGKMDRGTGDGRFRRGLRGRPREPARVPGPAVRCLVQRDGRRKFPGSWGRAGPDLRCLPASGPFAGGRIGVAGRSYAGSAIRRDDETMRDSRGGCPRDQALGMQATSLSPATTRMVGLTTAEIGFAKTSELLAVLAGVGVETR